MKTTFSELPEFVREIKKFSKKYKSLPKDLEEFKRIVSVIPLGNSKHFNIITRNEKCIVIKARLFCRYLKGKSLRIIYAYYAKEIKIDFIEIYFKGNKEVENQKRINDYVASL